MLEISRRLSDMTISTGEELGSEGVFHSESRALQVEWWTSCMRSGLEVELIFC